MAHIALYRKWRPLTFEDVVEQSHIVTALKNSIKNKTISHAYLFCGTRGTGKTTLAKILARAINCLNPKDGSPCNECTCCRGILDGSIIDVVEIDAASNNGVDDVREIKEAVMYVPALTRYKVYIIDEVHMLSSGAFNALLKTLEEPPENVVFILATTEPQKLPATILSRCQRFDFKRITVSGLSERLKTIAKDCGVSFEDSAINLIARLSEGGMRDAISLLDQIITLGNKTIKQDDVVRITGLSSIGLVNTLALAIVNRDIQQVLSSIKTAVDEGLDLQQLCVQLIDWFRSLMLVKAGGEALNLIEADQSELDEIKSVSEMTSLDLVIFIIKELSDTDGRLKWSENQRILLEVSLIKLCSHSVNADNGVGSDIISKLEFRIQQLEKMLSNHKGLEKPVTEKKRVQESQLNARPVSNSVKSTTPRAEPAGISDKRQLNQWPDVIEYVRSSGKMKVYAYLLDTKCIITDNNTAIVVVPGDDDLKKAVLSRSGSLEAITEALKRITTKDFKVKVELEKSLDTNTKAGESDPVLEKLIEFANQNNIPLDIKE